MYLIIVGAGRIGSHLTQLALQDGHTITLIEANEKRAHEASQQYDAQVLQADIVQGGILDEAGADQADGLVATTSDDSANLMAMFLGIEYGIKTLLSIVNDTRHKRLFERLGVHILVDPEMILAQHVYGILRRPKVEDVITLAGGAEMFEITLAPDSPLVGRSPAEASQAGLLGEGLLIVLLKRGGQSLVPSGQLVLAAGDHLTVFSQQPVRESLLKVFTG